MGAKKAEAETVVKEITDIDKRKREAVGLFQDVAYILKKENLVNGWRMDATGDDVNAYFNVRGTSKVAHLHAYVRLSHEMYLKSDRTIITSGREVDYNKLRRAEKRNGNPPTEHVIFNQTKSPLDPQIIVSRLKENWPV
ncbi:MAG: hypothetical protein KGH60_04625 [Candidatus Micrarchaeota archaeon]|nr:hypothetical protein [Candidatus Micrarchaeota archaeon]